MQWLRGISGFISFGIGFVGTIGVIWQHEPVGMIITVPMAVAGFCALYDWHRVYTGR